MPRTLLGGLLAVCLYCSWALPAPDGDDNGVAPPPAAAPADPRELFTRLEKEVYAAFKEKDFTTAAAKCQAQIELLPKQPGPYYNLACAQALQEKKAEALASLEKAVDLGYNDPAHMKQDSDLVSLREDKKFAELASKAADNEKKNPAGYEPGAEIKGVKSIEDLPEGGLRYRLRLSDEATAEKPHRVVIWLHPSGGSGNSMVESQLAADLARHGYALLVMTQKQWAGWNGVEAEKLLNKTLPAVLKQTGVAQEKPLLLGYSAGGQLALQLWEQNPTGFGGLILDAAYPIDMQQYMRGKQTAMKLPADEGIQKVPMYVLVGTADPGHQMWKQLEGKWREAGLPLTVEYVENGKHAWLMGSGQKKRLLAWLDEIAAGKLPGKLTAEELAAAKAAHAKEPDVKPGADEKPAAADAPPSKELKPRAANGQDDGLNLGDQNY